MIASSPIQHDKNIGEIRCFMSHSHACDLSDLSNLNLKIERKLLLRLIPVNMLVSITNHA